MLFLLEFTARCTVS